MSLEIVENGHLLFLPSETLATFFWHCQFYILWRPSKCTVLIHCIHCRSLNVVHRSLLTRHSLFSRIITDDFLADGILIIMTKAKCRISEFAFSMPTCLPSKKTNSDQTSSRRIQRPLGSNNGTEQIRAPRGNAQHLAAAFTPRRRRRRPRDDERQLSERRADADGRTEEEKMRHSVRFQTERD